MMDQITADWNLEFPYYVKRDTQRKMTLNPPSHTAMCIIFCLASSYKFFTFLPRFSTFLPLLSHKLPSNVFSFVLPNSFSSSVPLWPFQKKRIKWDKHIQLLQASCQEYLFQKLLKIKARRYQKLTIAFGGDLPKIKWMKTSLKIIRLLSSL